jgi:hypothetical protein
MVESCILKQEGMRCRLDSSAVYDPAEGPCQYSNQLFIPHKAQNFLTNQATTGSSRILLHRALLLLLLHALDFCPLQLLKFDLSISSLGGLDFSFR